jgi:hypothetical protein
VNADSEIELIAIDRITGAQKAAAEVGFLDKVLRGFGLRVI